MKSYRNENFQTIDKDIARLRGFLSQSTKHIVALLSFSLLLVDSSRTLIKDLIKKLRRYKHILALADETAAAEVRVAPLAEETAAAKI